MSDNLGYLNKLEKISTLFGNTPLLKMTLKVGEVSKTIYAKEEYCSPSGSIKIRSAYSILFDAINSGLLKEGQRIVEVTSGNMGISLAYLCKAIGNPITILMPKTMSIERVNALKQLGADVVLTNDFLEAFELKKKYVEDGCFSPNQFDNPSNSKGQSKIGEELLSKVNNFEAFVSGVGTGGTLVGVGSFLKSKGNYKVVAIDPKESQLLSNGKSLGKHKIQGLSDQIIPSIYKKELVDELINVSSDDSICLARRINKEFNLHIGISSGANLLGCVLSKYNKFATVFADDDSKYLSTDLYNESIQSEFVNSIKLLSVEKL